LGLIIIAAIVPRASPQAVAQTAAGTIAYVRPNNQTGDEIRLIEPNGSNDRRLWSVGKADPNDVEAITGLAWRPDAAELAFASNHENICSRYYSDIYTILAHGGGYRRVTNAPHCAALASYPKGTVTVTVRNHNFDQSLYQIYVAGAPQVKSVTVAPGGSTTMTINDVADFGPGVVQQVVAVHGLYRWFDVVGADVQPGQTVHAGTFTISGAGFDMPGAFKPRWRYDGSRIGYTDGCGNLYGIAANPQPGMLGSRLLNFEMTENGGGACVFDWGPTAATANQLLYATQASWEDDMGIFRVTEGSATRGTRLVPLHSDNANFVHDLRWLPDGAGFLFTMRHVELEILTDIYRYDFDTSRMTRLTNFADDEYVGNISIAPDGQHVVFERAVEWGAPTDLWIMRVDGSNQRLLVRNAAHPAWSPRALPPPPRRTYLPLIQR